MRRCTALVLVLLLGCDSDPSGPTAQLTGAWSASGTAVDQPQIEIVFEANLEQHGTSVTGNGSGLLPPESAAVPIPFTVSGSSSYPEVRVAFTAQDATLRFDAKFTDANTVVGNLIGPASSYRIAMRRPAVRSGSGIAGMVTLGPLCPVEGGPDCPRPNAPYVATLVFSASGAEVARATSSADGRYAIQLPPGTYRVEGVSDGGYGGFPVPPMVDGVEVQAEKWTRLDLEYDTGIR